MKRFALALGCVIAISAAICSTASADTAAITATDAGGGQMTATVSVTSTSCSTLGSCGWFAYVVERHSSLACADDETFPRGVISFQEKAGTVTTSFTFRPFFPRYTKLCVILSNSTGTASVGEALITLPSGYGYQRSTAYNCDNFSSQSAAEYYLELYPGDPSRLDADHDGSACEDNKCPCGAEAIPAEPEPAPAVSVPATTSPSIPIVAAPPTTECVEAKDGRGRARAAADRSARFLRTHPYLKARVASEWRKRYRKASKRLELDEVWAEGACSS
jgi:hypothetical protein